MAESNGISETAYKMTEAELKSLFDDCYREYLGDAQTNPLLKLTEEIKDLEKEIDGEVKKAAQFEEACEIMVRHQENFLHKSNLLQKTGTRTVGVNANISVQDNRNSNVKPGTQNAALGASTSSGSSLSVGQTQPELSKATVQQTAFLTAVQQRPSNPGVYVVDLTRDGDKNQSKLPRSNETATVNQPRQLFVTPTPQIVRGPLPSSARPVYQASSQIGSPQVQFAANNVYSAPMIGTPLPGVQQQRPILVLPPGISLNMRPCVANRLDGPRQVMIGNAPGTTALLLPRPPRHMVVDSKKTFATFSNAPQMLPKHPAPLPEQPAYPRSSLQLDLPPKPNLKISNPANGIVLSWNMPLTCNHAAIKGYQLFGYDEANSSGDSSAWKKVGEVKALPLPMACTLTQFLTGRRYHFAIRAVDVHSRLGPFSEISNISLVPKDLNVASTSK